MSLSTVNGKGAALSSSGGGSGSLDLTWYEAYSASFAAVATADLTSGGDGNKTIDSMTWTLGNVANASSVDVGSTAGGIKIVQPGATSRALYQGTRNGPWLYAKLRQFLVGTDAEGRSDIELRVSWRAAFAGGTPATNSEGAVFGLTTSTHSSNYYHLIYQGGFGGTNYGFLSEFPGTTIGGQAGVGSGTTPAVAYYPNCGRITLAENLVSIAEYSDDGAASLAAAVFDNRMLVHKLRTTSQIPNLNPGLSTSEMVFHFGLHKNSGANTLTDITLIEFKVEWRTAPHGGLVLLP